MNRSLTFDQIKDAESALAKSRAIVEVVSKSSARTWGSRSRRCVFCVKRHIGGYGR